MTNAEPLRIIFAGTPDFSVQPLQRLIEENLSPIAVFTQPDRPAGRGRQLQAGPVKQAALAAGIPVHQPTSLRNTEAETLIRDLEPDLMIVVAYGLILPAEILKIPVYGCWNIHASLLPRWRGAAPIQRAIESGDAESGVCIMQMDEGLDTGAVLHRSSIRLTANETGGSLHDRLAELGATALLDCVTALQQGHCPEPTPQATSGVTYARKLDKAGARLDWSDRAEELERRIRAYDPWPVAWCMIDGERTRIWKACVIISKHESKPGSILNTDKNGIDIATGENILRLLELQRPGKRRMTAADYLNAKTPTGQLDSDL